MTFEQWLRQSALPRNEARILLQHFSGMSRVQLITQGDKAMSSEIIPSLEEAVQRRLNGEPVAYILGYREFYGRLFGVNPNVLIPRPETEHLVEEVLKRLPQKGKVWDLGTGSGAIAITVALERKDAQVRASDISAGALMTAQQNAVNLGAEIEFASGSWFEVERPSERHSYDVIVSNPPYIESGDEHLSQGDLRFEPQNALTDFSDGLSCIRALAADAPQYLKSGGWLLLEHGYNQGSAARRILAEKGFSAVETLPDLAGLDRITLGQMVRSNTLSIE